MAEHTGLGHALLNEARTGASSFPPLLIAARRVADAIIHGVHGRRRSGPGEDFWQYRNYSSGDAAQLIDWRKSARSTKILVRENEWAATNTLWLWAGSGPGMAFQSAPAHPAKRDRAVILSLALGILATGASERIAAIGSPLAPGHTQATLELMAGWFHSQSSGNHQDTLPPPEPLPRHATAVFFSDFLQPADVIASHLTGLAREGTRGHLVQVLDPAEETLPWRGRTEFREITGPGRLVIARPDTVRARYQDKLNAHRARLRDFTSRLGWTFSIHHTDQPATAILLSLYGLISNEFTARTARQTG